MDEPTRILIVDDEAEVRRLTRRILEDAGYAVLEADAGADGLAMARREQPDLVLLDVMLPDANGLEICRRIKTDPDLEGVFVAMVSGARISAEDQAEGFESMADDYIPRPFTRREFLSRVDSLCRIQRAEKRLRANEERLRLALEVTQDGLWEHTHDGCGDFYSDRMFTMLGYQPVEREQAFGFFCDLLHPEDVERFEQAYGRLDAPGVDDFEIELRLRASDGEWRQILVRGRCVQRGEDGRLLRMIGTHTDLTSRRRLEREQIRLERVRAVGALAAGISHNLNNILTGVLMPAQLLQREIEDPRVKEDLAGIIEAAFHARDLVKRLSQSVRGEEEGALYAIDVWEVVDAVVETTRPKWKDQAEVEGIAIEMAIDVGELPPVLGSFVGLQGALLNVVLNAIEALPEGGRIALRARQEGERVVLRVEDTGVGMDEATCGRVFEPFFTTKATVDAGLGLSTTYGTVKGWGGDVQVESRIGEGTTVTFFLPIAPAAEPAEREVERLLIVDDDGRVAQLLSQLLSVRYEVEVARGGSQALARFGAGRFGVALIDLGMPGMRGDEVARRLREMDGALATVLITGWEIGREEVGTEEFDLHLQKPFDDLKEVEEMVARAFEINRRRSSQVERG